VLGGAGALSTGKGVKSVISTVGLSTSSSEKTKGLSRHKSTTGGLVGSSSGRGKVKFELVLNLVCRGFYHFCLQISYSVLHSLKSTARSKISSLCVEL